ncbi:MAG: hypothetical protein JKX98_07000 [Alcanivoracaceae bacterium]|nr:hypothetical protein [Alcanivoracaceae bacterium]
MVSTVPGLNVGSVSGEIYGNDVTSDGSDAKGITIHDATDASYDLNITGNEIYGSPSGGLFVNRSAGSGSMDVDISSNAFYRLFGSSSVSSGIQVINDIGSIQADIINNSITNGDIGICLT